MSLNRDLKYGEEQLMDRLADFLRAGAPEGTHITCGPRVKDTIRISGYLPMPDCNFYVRLSVEDVRFTDAKTGEPR